MLHQIGIGTLGPVFRTYEPARDRLVAVKVFRLDIVPEQALALADALRRATQASLFHPSIVEPLAAGVEGTVAYRAEEYVAAESLDVAMRHYAPASIEKGLPFITQIAGAIDFARAAGVGHGGLHPRDVFVTPDEARATGFGVVEALEAVGIRAPVRRPYTAPERIDGAPWGTAADVFSLAAIAFELLTGRRPAGTGAGIGALPDGPHSDVLHAVLARAMDENPAKRFPNALAFASALEAASRGQAVAAAAPAPEPAPSIGAATAAPAVAVATSAASPTPGEFAIERDLDPPFAIPPASEPVRGTERPQPVVEVEPSDLETELVADVDEEPARFADDFVHEQADPEIRRPLEAIGETVPPLARDVDEPGYGPASAAPLRERVVEERMLGGDLEPDVIERSRSPVLPLALMLVLGLLAGFAAGAYYMSGGDGAPAPAARSTTTAASPSPTAPAGPAGPATADRPGQYSEQKVTSPVAGGVQPTEGARPPLPGAAAASRGRAPSGTTPPAGSAARGRLVVQSTPSRAAVTIDGKWRGRTPLMLEDLPFGTYTVRVVQPGYRIAREDVTLSARSAAHTFAPRLELEPRPAAPVPQAAPPPRTVPPQSGADVYTGSIYVDSRPRGATVLVDGRSVGQTPLSLPGVPVGSHVVKIEMTGKRPWSATTRVTAGEMARVTGSLEDK